MEITMITPDEKSITLNVNPIITVEDLKWLMEAKTGVMFHQQQLMFDGKEMIRNSRRLSKYGVHDGDFLVMNDVSPSSFYSKESIIHSRRSSINGVNEGVVEVRNMAPPSRISNKNLALNPDGSAVDTTAFRRYILGLKHHQKTKIQENDPELYEILDVINKAEIKLQLLLRIRRCQRAELKHQRKLDQSADPYDVETLLEADPIRGKNKNWDFNLENIPHHTDRAECPYIKMYINGIDTWVLIDSGADKSFITESRAKLCELSILIKDHKETMNGAFGKQESVGLITIAPIMVGNSYFLSSFVVIKKSKVADCAFGMDLLSRLKCVLDPDAKILKILGIDVQFGEDKKQVSNQPKYPQVSSSRYLSGSSQTHELKGKVSRLVELGFDKKASINALRIAEGNEELAVEFLLG